MNDGMIHAAGEVRVGAFGMAPVGTVDLAPPRRGCGRLGEFEVVGEEVDEDERPAPFLSDGHPVGVVDEVGEALVGDGMGVHPERRQLELTNRTLPIALTRPLVVVAEQVAAARDRHQLRAVRGGRGRARHVRQRQAVAKERSMRSTVWPSFASLVALASTHSGSA